MSQHPAKIWLERDQSLMTKLMMQSTEETVSNLRGLISCTSKIPKIMSSFFQNSLCIISTWRRMTYIFGDPGLGWKRLSSVDWKSSPLLLVISCRMLVLYLEFFVSRDGRQCLIWVSDLVLPVGSLRATGAKARWHNFSCNSEFFLGSAVADVCYKTRPLLKPCLLESRAS